MATTVVKVQCDDGEIYRLTLQEEPSFETIVQLVASCCPEAQAFLSHSNCALKYADDEGDLCTLAPATFEDFLCMQRAQNSRLLKLRLKMPCSGRAPEKEDMPRRAPELDRKTLSDAELPSKSDTPPQGPPPGLEKEDQDRDFSSGPGAWGPGGNGGGPRRLLSTLRMLREAGMLTPAMFASLTVQWLPLLTQRVARKVDKINHMARDGLDATLQKMLEIVQDQAAGTPGLEHYAALIAEALGGRGGQRRLGEAILEMLKALRGLGFEVQTHFCESIASSLLPYLETLTSKWFGDSCASSCSMSWQHHPGSTCSGCGAAPIVGPRFKCPACPAYDLCGNCYPQKNQLHGTCPGCRKDFQCIISPGGKDGKFSSKGNDKAEKGEYHFDWKGAGKGAGGWMEAAMGLALAHQFSGGMLGFNHHLHNGTMPFGALDPAMFDEGQDFFPWPKGRCKGKGKGKGKNKQGKGHEKEEVKAEKLGAVDGDAEQLELDRKVADLLELQLANEEVIRDLLISNHGDIAQVTKILTS